MDNEKNDTPNLKKRENFGNPKQISLDDLHDDYNQKNWHFSKKEFSKDLADPYTLLSHQACYLYSCRKSMSAEHFFPALRTT